MQWAWLTGATVTEDLEINNSNVFKKIEAGQLNRLCQRWCPLSRILDWRETRLQQAGCVRFTRQSKTAATLSTLARRSRA